MVRKRNKNWVDTKELENIFAKILKKKEVDEEKKINMDKHYIIF